MRTIANRSRNAFTLLELLVVVAILAIIAGGLIAAYDGLEAQAGAGTSANSMASVDQAVRTFVTVVKQAPNGLDSLVAATGTSSATATAAPTTGSLLLSLDHLADHVQVAALTAAQSAALVEAGIDTLYYLDATQNTAVGGVGTSRAPNRIFDPTVLGTGGYGFPGTFGSTDTPAVVRWLPDLDTSTTPPTPDATSGNGLHNRLVGAGPTDVLVAFGLGNNSSMIGTNDPSVASSVTLAQAPFQVDQHRDEYGRFILLFNLGPVASPYSKARFQAVINSHGQVIDQKISEYIYQSN